MSQGLDPTLHTAALAALEAGVNRALTLSPQSFAQLEALDDCNCDTPVAQSDLSTIPVTATYAKQVLDVSLLDWATNGLAQHEQLKMRNSLRAVDI